MYHFDIMIMCITVSFVSLCVFSFCFIVLQKELNTLQLAKFKQTVSAYAKTPLSKYCINVVTFVNDYFLKFKQTNIK